MFRHIHVWFNLRISGTKIIYAVGGGTIQQMGHRAEVKLLISGTVAIFTAPGGGSVLLLFHFLC